MKIPAPEIGFWMENWKSQNSATSGDIEFVLSFNIAQDVHAPSTQTMRNNETCTYDPIQHHLLFDTGPEAGIGEGEKGLPCVA